MFVSTAIGNRKVLWWNHELPRLRIQTMKTFERPKISGSSDDYKKALTIYKKEIRNSKRKSSPSSP